MCVPVVAAALSIGQAVVGFAGASAQADAQNDYYMQNAREAQRAATVQYTNLNIRRDQTLESANQKLFEQSIDALQARGKAMTAAGEAGVAGNTVDDLVKDLFAQEGRRAQALDTQFKMENQEINNQMTNVEGGAKQRIHSVQRATPPNPLSYAIQGLSGVAHAFNPDVARLSQYRGTPGMGTS